jgi:RNA ligase (TIGR02306 family)
MYIIGDTVMFMPPETVIPFELSELLGITKYLSKGKVQVSKLRGNRSEGLVVDPITVDPFIDYIYQWEDLPTIQMLGDGVPSREIPPSFEKFYKMPNLRNEPNIFSKDEPIVWSEKIHGTNCRFGFLKHPETNEYQLYVGSHNIVIKENEKNIYWRVVKKNLNGTELPKDFIFYGEVYGQGIQDIHYNLKDTQSIKIFAIRDRDKYLPYHDVEEFSKLIDIDSVIFHHDTFTGINSLKHISNLPSEYYNGFREGVVIVSKQNPNKMAKVISETYLERKNKIERH